MVRIPNSPVGASHRHLRALAIANEQIAAAFAEAIAIDVTALQRRDAVRDLRRLVTQQRRKLEAVATIPLEQAGNRNRRLFRAVRRDAAAAFDRNLIAIVSRSEVA